MKDFDSYTVDGAPTAVNEKHGFCFEDNSTTVDTTPAEDALFMHYSHAASCGQGQPGATSIRHGLSPGWGDTYPTTLPDQGIDITAIIPPA